MFLQWDESLKPANWLFGPYKYDYYIPLDDTILLNYRDEFLENRLHNAIKTSFIEETTLKRKQINSAKYCTECCYDNEPTRRKCSHCFSPLCNVEFKVPKIPSTHSTNIMNDIT